MGTTLIVARGQSPGGADVTTPNLIGNGSFVDHAEGWYASNSTSDVVVGYTAADSRSAESGALSVAFNGSFPVSYRPAAAFAIPLDDLETLDAVAYAKAGAADRTLQWNLVFYSGPFASSAEYVDQADVPATPTTLSTSEFTQCAEREIVVPVGATHIVVNLLIAGADTADPVLIDDVYLGPPLGDTAQPAVTFSGLTGNRIGNGDFETTLAGWQYSQDWGDETIERDTVAPITGTASLKVTTNGGGVESGTSYADNPRMVVVPGETLRVSFRIKGAGALKARMVWAYTGPIQALTVWTGTATAEAQLVDEEITVPAGRHGAYFDVVTTEAAEVTFWLDDVIVETP